MDYQKWLEDHVGLSKLSDLPEEFQEYARETIGDSRRDEILT